MIKLSSHLVHGCLDELITLLEECCFDPTHDRVVLVGDLVNKGELVWSLVWSPVRMYIFGSMPTAHWCATLPVGDLLCDLIVSRWHKQTHRHS